MKSNIANALDLEYDISFDPGDTYQFRPVKVLIEIGITEIDLTKQKIIRTISLPIKWEEDYPINPETTKLTGWSEKKLEKSGFHKFQVFEKLFLRWSKYGAQNRLWITDTDNEIPMLLSFFGASTRYHMQSRLNVSTLLDLQQLAAGVKRDKKELSLQEKLSIVGLEYEGRQHCAGDDSKNIARLFLALLNRGI